MAEAPDTTVAADDDEDDEDDEDDDDDDDDDDELEMGGEALSNSLCSSAVIIWKVGKGSVIPGGTILPFVLNMASSSRNME